MKFNKIRLLAFAMAETLILGTSGFSAEKLVDFERPFINVKLPSFQGQLATKWVKGTFLGIDKKIRKYEALKAELKTEWELSVNSAQLDESLKEKSRIFCTSKAHFDRVGGPETGNDQVKINGELVANSFFYIRVRIECSGDAKNPEDLSAATQEAHRQLNAIVDLKKTRGFIFNENWATEVDGRDAAY